MRERLPPDYDQDDIQKRMDEVNFPMYSGIVPQLGFESMLPYVGRFSPCILHSSVLSMCVHACM